MRLKKIKNASLRLESIDKYFKKIEQEDFSNFLKKDNLCIEIGCGKGNFIIENALLNKDKNFIAIEKYDSVLVHAVEKANKYDLNNLIFINNDINDLISILKDETIDTIFLNFSDPWPKNKHEKRRLTYKTLNSFYYRILKKDGSIEIKTDSESLFEYSISALSNSNFYINKVYLDLHNKLNDNFLNIETEYENKFKSKKRILKLIAQKIKSEELV